MFAIWEAHRFPHKKHITSNSDCFTQIITVPMRLTNRFDPPLLYNFLTRKKSGKVGILLKKMRVLRNVIQIEKIAH